MGVVRTGFKYKTLIEIVELLREWEVPNNGVHERIINKAIAEVTDEGHPLALKWYVKGLVATGLIQQVGQSTYEILYSPKTKVGEGKGKDVQK